MTYVCQHSKMIDPSHHTTGSSSFGISKTGDSGNQLLLLLALGSFLQPLYQHVKTAGRKDNPAQCIVQLEETHPGKEGSFTTRASNPRVPSSLLSRASSDGIGKSTCLAESLRNHQQLPPTSQAHHIPSKKYNTQDTTNVT